MKKKMSYWLLVCVYACLCPLLQAQSNAWELKDIYIRDPFILPDTNTKTYYLYRSADTTGTDGKVIGGVECFRSKDLQHWEGPKRVFTVPENNWITGKVWAPEVHSYAGKYYLFATLNSDIQWKKSVPGWPSYTFRGTQIFRADRPEGPFLPLGQFPQTPMERMALDGTLWVEEEIPYMVFCHEWVQIVDGGMDLVRLSEDLSQAVEAPQTLFHASAADWSTGSATGDQTTYVTDGCFLYRTHTGKLLMIWSSFKEDQYAMGVAESVTGRVAGPWRQQPKPLFEQEGGHGMIFRTFEGRLCIVFHNQNSSNGGERAQIYEIEDQEETLKVKGKFIP